MKKPADPKLLKLFRQSMVLVYLGMAVLLVFTDAFAYISPAWRYGAGLLILVYVVFRVYREFFGRS